MVKEESRKEQSVKEQFVVNIAGKSYVTYEGLLDLAHNLNLKSMEVRLLQIPSQENELTAICEATATTEDGKIYVDVGDASPTSVRVNFVPHIIRMASTRAKARALRDLTNVGMTAIEELSLEDNKEDPSPIDTSNYKFEKPSRGQIETLKKLAKNSNKEIDFSSLTRESAGKLIESLQ